MRFRIFFAFTDIPNSNKEADMMISLGILPTHTIVLDKPAGKMVVNFTVETVYDEFILNQYTKYNFCFQVYAILKQKMTSPI